MPSDAFQSTYVLAHDGSSITCLGCGMTSHNPTDVAERYCGHCHVFHEQASVVIELLVAEFRQILAGDTRP